MNYVNNSYAVQSKVYVSKHMENTASGWLVHGKEDGYLVCNYTFKIQITTPAD